MKGAEKLRQRIQDAAVQALSRHGEVAPSVVIKVMGWSDGNIEESWRREQPRPHALLERVQVAPDKLAFFLDVLDEWVKRSGLRPVEASYAAKSRAATALRFTTSDDDDVERRWRTHWVRADLSEKQVARRQEKLTKKPDIVVVDARKFDWQCAQCGGTGPFYLREHDATLCMTCVDFDHLVFLPSGDMALTRRAKAKTTLSAVVMYFRRSRKRWERRGILVEEEALAEAEAQCLGDAEARAARAEREEVKRQERDVLLVEEMTRAIMRLFPACPEREAREIAEHTAERGSGRVGRSAAGRVLDEHAVTLAVVAHARHTHTNYDELLMRGVEREAARDNIRDDVDDVLAKWRGMQR